MKKLPWLGLWCGSLLAASAGAQTIIDAFEYATDDELVAAWSPSGNTVISLSETVPPGTTSTKSMRAEFNFPSIAWATETIRGIDLPDLLSIGPEQYLTFRLKGDPAFAASDFHNLYLYAYDEDGNFGRWGASVPANSDWQIYNFRANTIGKPWDSPGLPDLSRIIRFAFFQYGSEAALEPYTAAIHIDDLMVRDTPLVSFPAPSAPRALIDDFESYADDAALLGSYAYRNSPATTATTASLDSPAPQGSKALKLAIDFASGQYPWGSVISANVPAFSFPTNAVVSFQFKGDPALAEVLDEGTSFWISFYDKADNSFNFNGVTAAVVSNEWTTVEAPFQAFWNNAPVDTGNLVKWRILVQGWAGTADSAPMSGAFYVDNIRMTVPSAQQPLLTMHREGGVLKCTIDFLTPQTTYDLQMTTDLTHTNLSSWNIATTINAISNPVTWTVPNNQPRAFFRLKRR